MENAPEVLAHRDVLRLRAERDADALACVYLEDGDQETGRVTYGELDRRARKVAGALAALERGSRVLLVCPSGIDYVAGFFGCLYAGMIAVPAYPPPAHRPMTRIMNIVRDADAAIVLATAALRKRIETTPELASLPCVAIDELHDAPEGEIVRADRHDVAFLQYTSGSTAEPRGVMVTHANLINNERILKRAGEGIEHRFAVTWLPIHHDLGLIGTVLHPIHCGFPIAIMPPAAFIQHPIRWLHAITRYRATGSAAPNFAYDLCVDRITPDQIATLDLSSWRVTFNGAEPVRMETMRRFARTFAAAGFSISTFQPCYGLAEATLMVSYGAGEPRSTTRDERELASAGRVIGDTEVAIVDADGRRVTGGETGEIWVRGGNVAAGYWNNPSETAHVFGARAADGDGPYLRTGDAGFVDDGELFIAGRLKDMIIVDGRNHYPQDIEAAVERSHPALMGGMAAAFAVEIDGVERLVIAAEVDRQQRALRPLLRGESETVPSEALEILRTVRSLVASEHELRLHALVLLAPGGLPRTSSGKRQRYLCRARYLEGSLGAVIA